MAIPADNQVCLWLDGFVEWLHTGACTIQERDSGELVSLGDVIKAPQMALLDRMYEQAQNHEPIEIYAPKARKEGVSTLCQALAYFLSSMVPSFSAAAAAHSTDGTVALWKITQRIHEHAPNRELAHASNRRIRWQNGSVFVTHTGAGFEIGRADTIYFLHISELGSWQIGKHKDQDKDSLTAIVNAVPKHQANTFKIYESTGQGPAGEFHRMCMKAAEEGSRKLLFIPWFDDPQYRLPIPEDFTPSVEEERLQRQHGLEAEQLAWRRATLAGEPFGGRKIEFHREFPSTLQECFEAAEGRVHPAFSREVHVRGFGWEQSKALGVFRAIDWGGRDPFVCLWLVHYPGPPGFSVDAGCKRFISEMFAYRRDSETHDPLHDCSHGPHCIRYAVTTFALRHHVHVYRELYAPDHASGERTLLTLCEDVQRLSGWTEAIPHAWIEGEVGEKFTSSVADRSRPDSIQLFSAHGVPCRGQVNLNTRLEGVSIAGKTEVEQGIDRVNELIVATVPLHADPAPLSPLEKMERELRLGRPYPVPVAMGMKDRMLRDEARKHLGKRRRGPLHPLLTRRG